MATPDPIEVRTLIDEIVAARENLAALESRWSALFAGKSESPRLGRKPDPNGATSRILAFLEDNPDQEYNAPSLQTRLGFERDKIESSLYNLFVAEKIARVGRGQYKAKPKEEGIPA